VTVITRPRLEELLFNSGVDIHKVDRGFGWDRYALPTRDWIQDSFGRYWHNRKRLENIRWTNGSQVCFHIAQLAAAFAGLCHDATTHRPKDTAFLFGEWWYKREDRPNHAVNFSMVYEEGQERLVWFEPQLGRLMELSDYERTNCIFLRV